MENGVALVPFRKRIVEKTRRHEMVGIPGHFAQFRFREKCAAVAIRQVEKLRADALDRDPFENLEEDDAIESADTEVGQRGGETIQVDASPHQRGSPLRLWRCRL